MYSIIYEAKVIDVVQNPTFVKVLPSGRITFTDKASANGIIGSDKKTIYGFEQINRKDAKVVTIEKISEKEFNRLASLLNSKQTITADTRGLNTAINETISKLSEICNNKIIDGFSVRLSDGKKHSFRLTAEDQINLLNLENQLNTGMPTFVYHATGEPCRTFTREDVLKIIIAYRKHILYHTTYFNAAKQHITSLVDVDKVNAFSYGTNIAWTVKDPALRKILQDGGVR
jgi:hypothetical protein